MEQYREKGQILTGIIHVNDSLEDTHKILETTDTPLNTLTEKELCPGSGMLEKFMESYR